MARVLVLVPVMAIAGCGERALTDNGVMGSFGETGFGPGEFAYPRAVEIAPDGRVFIVDKRARIQRFSAKGEFEAEYQMEEWKAGKPTGLGFDREGRLYVADTHYSRVIVMDRDFNEIARFGSKGRGDGEFLLPTDVAVDDEGNIFVAEYGGNDRISRFTPEYEFVKSFGGPAAGDARLTRPSSIAFDAEQTLWVADDCAHRICRFDRDGELVGVRYFGTMGRAPGQLRYPRGIAFFPDDTLLVTEFGNNRLQRFDKQGGLLWTWGGPGRQLGKLNTPWGAAVSAEGRVYVLDSGSNRVQIVRR